MTKLVLSPAVATIKLKPVDSAYPKLRIAAGVQGPKGDAGPGVPPGGVAGQVLAKTTNADYATGWVNATGTGDMLASVYDPNSVASDAFDQDNMVSGATNKNYTATEKTKLAGIATGATVSNSTSVADRTALAALNTTTYATAYLRESGREGAFIWDSSDCSAKVTVDTQQGIFVAPSSDTSGASGAWGRIVIGPLSAKWFGAKGDGVLNTSTGAYTGTDDAAALQCWEEVSALVGKVRWLPDGIFLTSEPILDGTIRSDIRIWGTGTLVPTFTTGALYYIAGARRDKTNAGIYTTADAAAGTDQLTVNDTSGLAAGQIVIIKDNSQVVYEHDADYGTNPICLVGEYNEILSVDSSTQITLKHNLKYSYGHNATAANSTTVHEFSNAGYRFKVDGITVAWDKTISYATPQYAFRLQRVIDVDINATFLNALGTCVYLYDCYDSKISGKSLGGANRNPAGDEIYIIDAANTGSIYLIKDFIANGGRHLVTAGSRAGDISCAHGTVVGCASIGMVSGAFDTHPGAHDWIFSGCQAWGQVGADGDSEGSATDDESVETNFGHAGFKLRGKNHKVLSCSTTGMTSGVQSANGSGHVIDGFVATRCSTAVNLYNTDHATVQNCVGIDCLTNGFRVSVAGTAANNDYSGNVWKNNRVIGNPSNAAFVAVFADDQAWYDDWRVDDFRADDATTIYSGVPDTAGQVEDIDDTGHRVTKLSSGRFVLHGQPRAVRRSYIPINNSTTISANGFSGLTDDGTNTNVASASTNFYTRQTRVYSASAASASSACGKRSGSGMAYLNDPGMVVFEFGWEQFQSGAAAFVGLRGSAALGTTDPSALTNLIGVSIDAGQTTWHLIHNDGSGTATTSDLGSTFPANTSATDVYRLTMWWKDATKVRWQLERLNTGDFVNGVITSDLPSFSVPALGHITGNTRAATSALQLAFIGMHAEIG